MEIPIDDVRSLLGSYVLELLVKQKEIEQLKAQIEKLTADKVQTSKSSEVSKLHALESDVLMRKVEHE